MGPTPSTRNGNSASPPGVSPFTRRLATTSWATLGGLARQPVFITNVTLLHHANHSLFQLRGFWTVMTQNVIFSRNTILGPFGYSIDLDSSSSANLVTNNYMKGCLWEGIFTECKIATRSRFVALSVSLT